MTTQVRLSRLGAAQPIADAQGNPTTFFLTQYNALVANWNAGTASPSGGTVTTVSVASANGFSGTVANATTTPAITLKTSVTGVLKGNGTALSAASAGTDYVAPGAATSSGLTMSTARLLGRYTASTGAIQEVSLDTASMALSSGGVLSAYGGSAVLGPAWTTFTLSGSTSTQLGKAGCNAATTTITMADNQRLEIEAYVYKTAGNEAILGVTNGTDGLYMAAQADGNIRPYYYKSGAATGIGGTGVDALHNITATYDMQWRIHNRPSSRQSVLAVSEGSWASTSFMTDVNVGINFSTTLTLFVRTDDTTKCFLRARVFS